MVDKMSQTAKKEPSPPRGMVKLTRFPSGFIGENLPPDAYRSLNWQEKCGLQCAVVKMNKEWIRRRLEEKGAAWLVVVNGDVVGSSPRLDEYPGEAEVLQICGERGRFPFVFVDDRLMMVEELSSPWSQTRRSDDRYPTARIEITHEGLRSGALLADMDTGAYPVFLRWQLASDLGLVQESPWDILQRADHPAGQFIYVFKRLSVGLLADDGTLREARLAVSCVHTWEPFLDQNPNRVALVGRELLNRLKPTVILSFADQVTKVNY